MAVTPWENKIKYLFIYTLTLRGNNILILLRHPAVYFIFHVLKKYVLHPHYFLQPLTTTPQQIWKNEKRHGTSTGCQDAICQYGDSSGWVDVLIEVLHVIPSSPYKTQTHRLLEAARIDSPDWTRTRDVYDLVDGFEREGYNWSIHFFLAYFDRQNLHSSSRQEFFFQLIASPPACVETG